MVDPAHSALLLLDVQPDFMPGGALPVAGGDEIVAPIGKLLESATFRQVAATQDWHPPGHISFASQHPGHAPFDVISLYGHDQVLWPDHCVQGTPGAELHTGLPSRRVSVVVRKGSDSTVDSYSGFRSNWNAAGKRPPTGLAGYLRELGVDAVYICGLARDVCVKWTAEDAADLGFDTTLIWDLTRPVDPGTDAEVRAALVAKGVRIVRLSDM
jgi:nicotinamidase/pyrazinamidase